MLYYPSLVCLLLLVSIVSSHNGEWRSRYHKAGPDKHYVIAPESNDAYSKFVVAEYGDPIGLPPQLKVTVRVYNDSYQGQLKECSHKYKGRWSATKLGVSSLNRLKDNKIVLTWYDELKDHMQLRTRIVVIDMNDDCKEIYLEHTEVAGRVIVVPIANQNKFDLFVDDKYTCLGNGDRCRILYNLDSNLFGLRRPFHDKFDWSTVHIERLANEDLVVHGYLDDEYQIIRVYHDGTNQILDHLKYGKSKIEFVSSATSYCWMNNTHSYKKVNCTLLSNNNKLIYRKIIEFVEPRVLIDVSKTRDYELILITKKKHCADDCWKMYATYVRDDGKKSLEYTLTFNCTGDQKELVVFAADYDDYLKKVDFYYACRNGNEYNFNMWYL